jgi:hypothetical protein
MKGRSSFRKRAPRSPLLLFLCLAAATVVGVSVGAILPAGNDPLRELPAQSQLPASAAFTHPGPQVLYAAP